MTTTMTATRRNSRWRWTWILVAGTTMLAIPIAGRACWSNDDPDKPPQERFVPGPSSDTAPYPPQEHFVPAPSGDRAAKPKAYSGQRYYDSRTIPGVGSRTIPGVDPRTNSGVARQTGQPATNSPSHGPMFVPVLVDEQMPDGRFRRRPTYALPSGELVAHDPLEAEVREIVAEIGRLRFNGESETPEQTQSLKELLEKQFNEREKLHQQQIDTMRADLDRAAETLKQRKENKERIIERHLAKLLGKRDPLSWDYSPNGPVPNQPSAYVSPGLPWLVGQNLAANSYPNPPVYDQTGVPYQIVAGQVDNRVHFQAPGAYGPSLPESSSEPVVYSDLIALGYEVLQKWSKYDGLKRLSQGNAASAYDPTSAEREFKQSLASWKSRLAALEQRLQIMELEIVPLKQQVTAINQQYDGGQTTIENVTEQKTKLQIKEIERDALFEQIKNAKAFEKEHFKFANEPGTQPPSPPSSPAKTKPPTL